MLELLAPAGSMEAVTAAVQNGANAIYLGYGDFNARRNAKNFTQEEVAAAVSYCHLRGCKVHLTLNTLLTDRELPGAAQVAAHASDIGIDAVIVQDLGVARMLRQTVPDLAIHGSTQMTVHSLDGVKQCADLGMSRVVLSRELSRDQIAGICQNSPIEIEIFGHGALCMSYSGQCYFSSVIGGRSGNRGLCAQPCRLKYGWGGKANEYPLSLKDMSLISYLKEIQDMGGIYCGINAVSKNLLICNRKNLLNPHGFILGVSGSGKSFTMKEFITFIALATRDDIIIIDAEREYGETSRALHGTVLELSPNSPHHINPLEIARGYGMGENPVAMKSELLMSICEQQMGEGQLGAFHKSIIDRCTASVYHEFIKSGGKTRQPTLFDWRNEVKRQPEREAQELALASELFVEGSLNMFAHETNVDMDNRLIVFDLYEMGEQLKPTALNVTMETIQNRVATNRLAGKYTWIFVDEVYLFFKYYYSAQFLYKAWKRFRKYGAALTAATQNVEECLRSETARLMFANSEFLVLLNQAATDRAELAKLLNISENQMGYVTNVEAGHGLLRVAGSIVPFANEFPRTGELYQLWNTTPTDK